MTKRDKNLLILLTIVILGAAFYYFYYRVQVDKIATLETEIQGQKQQLMIYNNAKRNVAKLGDQKEKLTEVLKKGVEGYLTEIEQEEIILLLNEIIIRSDVEVSNIKFSNYKDTEKSNLGISTMIVTIGVSGSYEDTIDFLSSYLRFDKNIYVSNMSMSSSADIINTDLAISFIRMDNDYTEPLALFEWYNDTFYEKATPFEQDDFSTLFRPNYFYTGTDVEFYNPAFEGFNDTYGHWSEDVFNLFGRNGYILGDDEGNVRPDEPMTRLETVLLLDLVFRWELQENFIELQSFADYDIIDALSDIEKKALLKGYNSGYLFGYEDNTLRPYSNISYEELGFLGNNLLGSDITWLDVAGEIRDNFGYESVGIQTPTAPATRAEIIYFLSYINDRLVD